MAIDPWACVALASPLWSDTINNFLLWQGGDKNDILVSPSSPLERLFSKTITAFFRVGA